MKGVLATVWGVRSCRTALGGRTGAPFWLFLILALLGLGPALAAIPDGPDGQVLAVARAADGTTYFGGSFTRWGPQTGYGAALDAAGGAPDRAFPYIGGGDVRAAIRDGAGGWYIGGYFTSVGGQARNRLAHIDASGAVTDWNPGANNTVAALAPSPDGNTVYAGGNFSTIGGGCGTVGKKPCTVRLNKSKTVTAKFVRKK